MNIVKRFLFVLFVVAGMAFAVSAQKNDPKKPPKNPPTVDPGKKNPADATRRRIFMAKLLDECGALSRAVGAHGQTLPACRLALLVEVDLEVESRGQ